MYFTQVYGNVVAHNHSLTWWPEHRPKDVFSSPEKTSKMTAICGMTGDFQNACSFGQISCETNLKAIYAMCEKGVFAKCVNRTGGALQAPPAASPNGKCPTPLPKGVKPHGCQNAHDQAGLSKCQTQPSAGFGQCLATCPATPTGFVNCMAKCYETRCGVSAPCALCQSYPRGCTRAGCDVRDCLGPYQTCF